MSEFSNQFININFFRESLETCSHSFAIPLPFSARSLAYTSQHFYLVRDDSVAGDPNLYSISDHNLIGGYLYWLEISAEQSRNCSENELPISFPLYKQVQNLHGRLVASTCFSTT